MTVSQHAFYYLHLCFSCWDMSTFLPRKRPIRTGLAEKNSTVSLFTHELRMLGFVFFELYLMLQFMHLIGNIFNIRRQTLSLYFR